MKLTQIAVVATALFGGANALAGDGHYLSSDPVERGVDCSATGADSYEQCSCWTDLETTWYPPTMINDAVDFNRDNEGEANADVRETGLYSYDADADPVDVDIKTSLEVAFQLHPSVYTDTATHYSGFAPRRFNNIAADDATHLVPNQEKWATANRYANPTARFVNADNSEIGACVFTTIGDISQTTTQLTDTDGAFFVTRPAANEAAEYGTDAAGCDDESNRLVAYFRTDFKEAIGDCGFTNDRTDGAGIPLSEQTDPVTSSTYTRYLGRIKVQTTRQNGELRAQEMVLVEEYAFQISILFPEEVTVTSSAVSIIGSATYDAQLTHQIYDSASNNLNLNMFVGTTYPFALSTATLAGPNLEIGTDAGDTISASLALQADKALTAYLDQYTYTTVEEFRALSTTISEGVDTADWAKYCQAVPTEGQGAAYNLNLFCDHNNDGPDLADFVTVANAGELNYDANTDEEDGAYFGVALPGDGLIEGRCSGENGQTQDLGACLQNAFMRLQPRQWYCDFNLALELTLTTTCRDDTNGDAGTTPADSIQSDQYVGAPGSGARTPISDWPTLTSSSLYNADGTALPCSSAQYRAATKADQTFTFQLASDNFCPRTIATVTTDEMSIELGVYESSFGETTWGAHTCTDQASCEADVIAAVTDAAVRSSNCDGSSDHAMCVQVPGYAADSDPSAYNDNDALTTNDTPADQRKTQNEFVFGTTTYLETRVSIDAGVNIESTTINELWIAKTQAGAFPTGETTADDATWQKRLIIGGAINDGTIVGVTDSYVPHDNTAAITDISDYVKVSNSIVSDSMIIDQTTDPDTVVNFFDTNPALKNTAAARLGTNFEGVSRATVLMNKYTVQITDSDAEDAEPITFFAKIAITYKAANEQVELGLKEASQKIGSDAANRARSLAAPTVTGGQASAQAGIRPAGTTGAAGSSSTIAGFSSTTVLAAAAVLGAIVVAAGASFFVVRKRRTAAAKTAKRSSSSTELNDTAQVQV